MKTLLYILFLLVPIFAPARNLVPVNDGEGSIGDTNAYWEELHVGDLFLDGSNINDFIPTNAGVTSINGLLGDIEFQAGPGFLSSNQGSTVYLNLYTNDFSIGTNIATFQFVGTEQYFQVPATVTNMRAWLWGGGGGGGYNGFGGGGGYTEVDFPVLPFEILTIVVGEGGKFSGYGQTTQIAITPRAYPEGGRGVSARSNDSVGGGGGRSQILRGSLSITNENRTVAVAGGGGGATDYYGGAGGGDSGGSSSRSNATYSEAGGPAQTLYDIASITTNIYTNNSVVTTSFVYAVEITGYAAGTSYEYTGTMEWTNQPGGKFFGGDGGLVDDANAGWVGGGGDGWYGGGGGFSRVGAYNAGGGGGMGFVNAALSAKGRTVRAINNTPAGTENTYFISNVARGGYQQSYPGGNGLVILQY